jgi:hypothetical protein
MQWYKINLSYEQVQSYETISIINRFAIILNELKILSPDNIGIFKKVAHNGSLNVFFSQETYKHLQHDLVSYDPAKCLPPSKETDEEGFGLTLAYCYGNPKLLL